MDPSERASKLIPRMGTNARQVCLNAGGDSALRGADVGSIWKVLRTYFQSDAIGRICQQETKFSQSKRAHQYMGRYLLEFEFLLREAGARVFTGGASPHVYVSISRMQNAAPSRNGKSLLLAGVHGVFGFPFCGETNASFTWTLWRVGPARCFSCDGFGYGVGRGGSVL